MGKHNLIFDNALWGVSAENRTKSRTDASKFNGHPCMKYRYGSRALDRFRGQMARYWGFRVGGSVRAYGDFGYLNTSRCAPQPPAGSTDPNLGIDELNDENNANLIGFKIVSSQRVSSPASYHQPESWALGDGSAANMLTKYFGSPVPLQIEPIGDHLSHAYASPLDRLNSSVLNLDALNRITVQGDVGAWEIGSDYQHMTSHQSNQPLWSIDLVDTWKLYAAGDLRDLDELSETPATTMPTSFITHPASGYRTLHTHTTPASTTVYPGFLPPTDQMFYDHVHEFISPISAHTTVTAGPGAKKASIEANYNFFSKNYENAIGAIHESLLPNPYILFNAIDKSAENLDPSVDVALDPAVEQLYNKVVCVGGLFDLPSTRDQIHTRTTKTDITTAPPTLVTYGADNKTYIQKYYSALEGLDVTTLEEPLNRAQHIGYARDFVANNFTNYNSEVNLPFGISIEFDTRLGAEDMELTSRALDHIPGAHDFLLQNIMLMNISKPPATDPLTGEWLPGWNAAAGGSTWQVPLMRGDEIFGVSTNFRAQISDSAGGKEYYGFNIDKWGDDVTGGPWYNRGSYNLKTLNLPEAMAYALRMTDSNLFAKDAPPTMVGPTTYSGVAFKKGMFVGLNHLAESGVSDTAASVNYGSDGNWLIERSDFFDLCRGLFDVIDLKRRTFIEILTGAKAYSETIAFRIAKHKVANGTVEAEPIQNFYLPNIGNATAGNTDTLRTKLKYVDTQVKYGQKYVYKVYAYNLVIGDQYHYKGLGSPPESSQPVDTMYSGLRSPGPFDLTSAEIGLQVDAHQFPSVQIIEAPYYTYQAVEVRDLPPVFPEVEVVPFKGVNDKIRLLLQTQDVKYAINPEKYIISDSDVANYNLQRTFQGRPTGPLVFGSDDTEITFEIYRTTQRPTSYRDFDGMLLDTVPGLTPSGRRVVNIGYDDTIEPNRKYYYTFRTIDYHASLSIPSPIYQVEIVDDNGRMYPIIDIFYIDNHVGRRATTTKPLRKYLRIAPNLPQSAVNITELESRQGTLSPTDGPGTGLLGTLNDGVWSPDPAAAGEQRTAQKIFKIRLTSKQTGKKIDLNVQFKETSTINPDGLD